MAGPESSPRSPKRRRPRGKKFFFSAGDFFGEVPLIPPSLLGCGSAGGSFNFVPGPRFWGLFEGGRTTLTPLRKKVVSIARERDHGIHAFHTPTCPGAQHKHITLVESLGDFEGGQADFSTLGKVTNFVW
jgi:hypothetical protein